MIQLEKFDDRARHYPTFRPRAVPQLFLMNVISIHFCEASIHFSEVEVSKSKFLLTFPHRHCKFNAGTKWMN
jgi:hypothetical protein